LLGFLIFASKCVALVIILGIIEARSDFEMPKTSSLNIRISPEIKSAADSIFSNFGISLSDAVNIFLHKSIMVGGLPFEMTMPEYNAETLAAAQEAQSIISGRIKAQAYDSVAQMNAALDAEDEV
jgi:DNA-damage-inducible protein J